MYGKTPTQMWVMSPFLGPDRGQWLFHTGGGHVTLKKSEREAKKLVGPVVFWSLCRLQMAAFNLLCRFLYGLPCCGGLGCQSEPSWVPENWLAAVLFHCQLQSSPSYLLAPLFCLLILSWLSSPPPPSPFLPHLTPVQPLLSHLYLLSSSTELCLHPCSTLSFLSWPNLFHSPSFEPLGPSLAAGPDDIMHASWLPGCCMPFT